MDKPQEQRVIVLKITCPKEDYGRVKDAMRTNLVNLKTKHPYIRWSGV